MKNLPARLRKHADEVLDPGYPYYGTPEMVREAADEIERLRLTGEEREAIGVAIQCVEASMAQRHPEEEEARDLLWKTTCGLRSLLDRTDRT